jgi:hypothetical protein
MRILHQVNAQATTKNFYVAAHSGVTGAGGAIFTNSGPSAGNCASLMASRLGLHLRDFRPWKLNFVSNYALAYGNRIASEPSSLNILGSEQALVSLCGSNTNFYSSTSGNITVARTGGLYKNNAECSVILAPFGANTLIIEFQSVSIECATADNFTRETAWENSSFHGLCRSCDFDYLQVDACFDSNCEYTRLITRICGSELATWTAASHNPLKKTFLVESGIVMLTFHSDNMTVSTGFNATFSSIPAFEKNSQVVPGQDNVLFNLVQSDKFQSIVHADQDSRYVQVLVCPPYNPGCTDLNSLVPASFFRASEDFIFRVPSNQFFKCFVGESVVVLHFSVADLHVSHKVLCLPCQNGQSRVVDQSGTTWSCVSCSKYQYIVDPNVFRCQDCPKGAKCDGISLQGLLAGSIWEPDNVTGQYILKSCPPVLYPRPGSLLECRFLDF